MGAAFYNQDTTRPNRISAYIWNPSGGEGAGAYFEDALTPGEWIHVVAVYDPGDMDTALAGVRIYKNGVLRKGPPDPGTLYGTYDIVPADGSAPVRFATRDGNSFFTGGLDEVAIYQGPRRAPRSWRTTLPGSHNRALLTLLSGGISSR